MIYRIDLTPDRQFILFWTGIGKKESAKTDLDDAIKLDQQGYSLKAKLDDGFTIVGTRIELIEQDVRRNYQLNQSKKDCFFSDQI